MADKLRIINRGLQKIGAKRLTSLTEVTKERQAVDAAYDDIVEQELMTNFWTFAIARTKLEIDLAQRAETATIAAAGSGYAINDVLTLVGGTSTQVATFTVTAIDGSGGVTDVALTLQRGLYTAVPANPVSTTVAPAGGTGCTLTVTFDTGPFFGRGFQYTRPSDYLRSAPFDPQERAALKRCLFEGDKILSDDGGPLQLRYVRDFSILPAGITNAEELFHPLFANAISMRLAVELAEELTGSSTKGETAERAYTKFVSDARRIDAIEAGPIEPEVDEFVAVRQTTQDVDPTLRNFN